MEDGELMGAKLKSYEFHSLARWGTLHWVTEKSKATFNILEEHLGIIDSFLESDEENHPQSPTDAPLNHAHW